MAERRRRQARQISPVIDFNLTMTCTVSQDKFLSNEKNKKRLIHFLRQKLEAAGFKTNQAFEDADTQIVQTAIEIDSDISSNKPVIIVAEDIDVLVIFILRVLQNKNIYFWKPSKGKKAELVYDCNSFYAASELETCKLTALKNLVGFIHAFSGCDTTSVHNFHYCGKHKLIKTLLANEDLMKEATIFNEPTASPEQIKSVGSKIIVAMHIGKRNKDIDLNKLRFLCYKKGCIKKNFHLSTLPPTKSAADQHSFRTYLQVQQWFGNELDPQNWGWQLLENGLEPIQVTDTLLPENLLKNISCKCTKGCTKSCSCVKHGLKCSEYCSNCEGDTCKNTPEPKICYENIDLDDESEEETEDLEFENAVTEDISNMIQFDDEDENDSEDENEYEDEDEAIRIFPQENLMNKKKKEKVELNYLI